MSKLPANWTWSRVGDLIELGPRSVCDDGTEVGFVPLQRLGVTFRARHTYEVRHWREIKKGYTHFADGDVLLARITPSFENGKAGIARKLPNAIGAGSTEYFVCRPIEGALIPEYLLAHFKTPGFLRDGQQVMSGAVGQQRVPKQYVLDSPLPLAPFNEQKRIANKLDTVLARADTCRVRLDRVPAILRRFRQSVLAAAVSGKLTEGWRDQNRNVGSGADQIARDSLAKAAMLASDSTLEKKKSSANSELDISYIFEIPESWAFTTWGKLTEWITYGFTRPMPSATTGIKLVTAKDVQNFSIHLSEAGYTTQIAFRSLSEKDRPEKGDLLITKDGTIGRAALVNTDEAFCINQSVAVCWLRSTTMNKKYIELVANADFTQRFVLEKAKGMAIQHLSITDLAQAPLPVPPLAEQDEIVRRVEDLFAYADRIQLDYDTARSKVENLTPAVIAKAFRGELLPQDPNDEPASVLLQRIRSARAAKLERVKQTFRGDRKTNAEIIVIDPSNIPADYLAQILKRKGRLSAKALWQASNLGIEDFYAQLRLEEKKGHLREIKKTMESYLEVA